MDTELISTGYEQIGAYYRVSVDVTTFTWQMFAARNAALLAAAGYICFKVPRLYGLASLLLVLAAFLSLVTARQMDTNQKVIQRTLAAGSLMELRHPELGSLFRQSINDDDYEIVRKKYSGALERVLDEDLHFFGLPPTTAQAIRMYAAIYIGLALLVAWLGWKSRLPNMAAK